METNTNRLIEAMEAGKAFRAINPTATRKQRKLAREAAGIMQADFVATLVFTFAFEGRDSEAKYAIATYSRQPADSTEDNGEDEASAEAREDDSDECGDCEDIDECDACRERYDRRCEAETQLQADIRENTCCDEEDPDENLLFQARQALPSVEFTRGSRTSHYGTYERGGVRVHIRVSDHYAPGGSGYDRFSGKYYRVPDIDLVDDERYYSAKIRRMVAAVVREKRQAKRAR